ncbi:MAG: zincin-like metallopeptidase domain-containing protein [Promethearchaeota archaeon]
MKIYKDITEKFIAALEEMLDNAERGEEVKWVKPWSPRGVLHSNVLTPNRAYSGVNQFMCDLYCKENGWTSRYWITRKGIKKNGGKLLPGEEPKVIYGFIPYFIKVELDGEKREHRNEEAGEVRNSGSRLEEEERYEVVYHVWKIPIYNVDQCVNIRLPKSRVINKDKKAERIIERMVNKPRIVHEKINTAFYNIREDCIHLPRMENFKSKAFYYDTLFHELAHSTGHSTRLNRKTLNSDDYFNNHLYAEEELIAEIASTFLSNYCGITCERSIKNNIEYVRSWATQLKDWKKSRPQKLTIYIWMARRASDYILGRKPLKIVKINNKKNVKKIMELSLHQDIMLDGWIDRN